MTERADNEDIWEGYSSRVKEELAVLGKVGAYNTVQALLCYIRGKSIECCVEDAVVLWEGQSTPSDKR